MASVMNDRIAHGQIAINAKQCLRLSPLTINLCVELRQLANRGALESRQSRA
jgi:hypothetical protein